MVVAVCYAEHVATDPYRALAVVPDPADDEAIPIDPKPMPREFPDGWHCGICGHEPLEVVTTSNGPALFCSLCESLLASFGPGVRD